MMQVDVQTFQCQCADAGFCDIFKCDTWPWPSHMAFECVRVTLYRCLL